jgi:hypothetical protein
LGGGSFVGGSGGSGAGGRGGGGSGSSDDASGGGDSGENFLLKGWRDRVAEDPSFPFKVLVEQARAPLRSDASARLCLHVFLTRNGGLSQIIGVGAAVLGDMSSRPNWGLYELDFVFSTVIVRLN